MVHLCFEKMRLFSTTLKFRLELKTLDLFPFPRHHAVLESITDLKVAEDYIGSVFATTFTDEALSIEKVSRNQVTSVMCEANFCMPLRCSQPKQLFQALVG
jgi:hypothetical protein